MENQFKLRQKKVVGLFPKEIDALLLTNLSNVRYLSGFEGSCGFLLLSRKCVKFFTDFRYQEQADDQVGKAAEIQVFKTGAVDVIVENLKEQSIQTLGVEGTMDLSTFEALHKGFKKNLKTVSGLPEKIRRNKDKHEIALLKKSFQIADKAFAQILKYVKPGRKELDVAARLEYDMRKAGSEGPSFSTIIASGTRASCPHAQPTSKKMQTGEMVKIDFGAIFGGTIPI